jgi:hypothetical protein
MKHVRAPSVGIMGQGRSAISNGRKLLAGLDDGRTTQARRYRDVELDIPRDVAGSFDELTTTQQQRARTAAGFRLRGCRGA